MDSMHDLGGKQGFGPIDTSAPPFRHDWEWRQWALSQTIPIRGLSIDASRWITEMIPGPAYLSMPYFEKWCLRDMAMMALTGTATLAELTTGRAATPGAPPPALTLAAALDALRARERDFSGTADSPPVYGVGDRVTTHRAGHAGHTRLPAYARAADGTVIAHHGAHAFPDAVAEGRKVFHHLYTVAFAAADLWPEGDPRDEVRLDLWEPYLHVG